MEWSEEDIRLPAASSLYHPLCVFSFYVSFRHRLRQEPTEKPGINLYHILPALFSAFTLGAGWRMKMSSKQTKRVDPFLSCWDGDETKNDRKTGSGRTCYLFFRILCPSSHFEKGTLGSLHDSAFPQETQCIPRTRRLGCMGLGLRQGDQGNVNKYVGHNWRTEPTLRKGAGGGTATHPVSGRGWEWSLLTCSPKAN